MGSDSEPAKLLLPFLQRADELQKHEPLVAYYCRLYAMEKGLKISQKERTKTTNALLISLMNQLEKDKKSIKIGPEDYLYVEGFASNVFAKADKQDRAGRADLDTAKTFYAASIFFEILNQFGELQPDIEQKLKYAVWKAADIRKAIKEGRKPEPGPLGGDEDPSIPSSSSTSSYDLRQSENFSSAQPDTGTPIRHEDPRPRENFSSAQPAAGTPTHHEDFARNESFPSSYQGSDPSPQPPERVNSYSPSQPPPPPSHPSSDYHPTDYHQLPQSNNTPDISNHPQHYQTHSYPTDQHPTSQNFHYQENPSPPPPYSYPNFQSYPSFHDSSFPPAPAHRPSYYHGADASSTPSISNHPAAAVTYGYGSGNENNHVASQAPPSAAAYTYDCNYQPPVEKITEAHKAARFAVGALAFDDVPVAVEFLRKSLELLTNPKAESH